MCARLHAVQSNAACCCAVAAAAHSLLQPARSARPATDSPLPAPTTSVEDELIDDSEQGKSKGKKGKKGKKGAAAAVVDDGDLFGDEDEEEGAAAAGDEEPEYVEGGEEEEEQALLQQAGLASDDEGGWRMHAAGGHMGAGGWEGATAALKSSMALMRGCLR